MTLDKSDEMLTYLLDHESVIMTKVQRMVDEKIPARIWEHDHTVWSESDNEITNRLGWLHSPEVMSKAIDEINDFVAEVRNAGFKNALLMGMGGSSLAPEVFRLTFGVRDGYLDLSVLDSTHPEAVKEIGEKLDPKETLYIVSTKSGGTVETMSFMKYFFNQAKSKLSDDASKHFIAITDPGSGLEDTAKSLNFRKIFLNDPNIGGRFSALSFFGLVPAALVGVNISNLLERAGQAANETKINTLDKIENNSAAVAGVIMGELANKGIDKVTFITSPQLKYFGGWVEQLIAESTGKNGKGILPVDLEEVLDGADYSNDRFFVYLKLKSDFTYNERFTLLREANHPAIQITLDDVYDLGREFMNWEFATSVASWVTGITPFDQPNVESAKIIARQKMADYKEKGELPKSEPDHKTDVAEFFGNFEGTSIPEIINNFISDNKTDGSYVSIHAYLKPSDETWKELQCWRTGIQKKYKVATTLGYGPRFLHSTGQLHKGDGGNGLFIQLTENKLTDLPIPDEAGKESSTMTFDALIDAQSLGDMEALLNENRKVLKINFTKPFEQWVIELH
jgi:glucose-6-phosphate isomerase